MTSARFTSAADVARFAIAGDAVLTVSSEATGKHYTFRIREPGENSLSQPCMRFVSVRTGEDYLYLGIIPNVERPSFRTTKKSALASDSGAARAARYLCERVLAHPEAPLPSSLVVRHEGQCGRCGRPLTHPESIDTGFGPICAAKLGISLE